MERISRKTRRKIIGAWALIGFVLLSVTLLQAQTPIPKITIGVDSAQNPGDVAVTLQVLLLLTVLSLVPAIIVMMTSFTRIVIVFSFLRHGLGTQQSPPTQVVIGLAMFLMVITNTEHPPAASLALGLYPQSILGSILDVVEGVAALG